MANKLAGEILAAANPQPRLGQNYQLPVIYAGNKVAQPDISKTLKEKRIRVSNPKKMALLVVSFFNFKLNLV